MKLAGDTKLAIASAVVLGLGVWYIGRQVKGAAGAAWGGLTDGMTSFFGSAYDGASSALNAAADVVGGRGYTDPKTGTYTPYGAVPDSFRAEPGTYLGGWASTAIRQAEQADVRRLDNAIARAPDQLPAYDAMGNQTGFFN